MCGCVSVGEGEYMNCATNITYKELDNMQSCPTNVYKKAIRTINKTATNHALKNMH